VPEKVEDLYEPLELSPEKSKQLAEWIHKELVAADEDRSQYVEQIKRADKLYEGHTISGGAPRRTKNTPFEKASDVHLPMTATFASAIHARLYTTLFGQEPFFIIRAIDKRLKDKMTSFSKWLQWVLTSLMDWENQLHVFLADVSRYPMASLRLTWLREERPWLRYDLERNIIKDTQLIRSIPEVTAWPPEDFFWPIVFDNTEKAPWVAFRTWLAPGQALQMENQNKLKNVQDSISHALLLELFECWIQFDIDDDKNLESLKVVVDPYLLPSPKAIKIAFLHPYFHQRKPVVTATYERRPHTLPGSSIPHQVGDLNEVLDTIHNQNLDAAHVAIANVIAHPPAAPYVDQLRKIWPGKRISVPDPSQIVPISLGDNKATSINLEQVIRSMGERRVFLSDFAMGREPSPARRGTATGTLAIIQEGQKHFDSTIKDIRRCLREAGYQIIELCAQYMEQSFVAEHLGPEIAADVFEVLDQRLGPIRGSIGLDVSAQSAAVNRDVERQNSILLFNIATQYYQQLVGFQRELIQMMAVVPPEILAPMRKLGTILAEKASNLVADISKTFDRHPDELVPSKEEINELLGQPAPGPAGGPGASGVPGVPGPGGAAAPAAPPESLAGFFTAGGQPVGAGEPGTEGG
jgi:hypothetical protein